MQLQNQILTNQDDGILDQYQLSEERRKEIIKIASEFAENLKLL